MPIAVGGSDGIAVAVVTAAGMLYVQTDNWSGGATHWDLAGLSFPVWSEDLAQAVEAAAAITASYRPGP